MTSQTQSRNHTTVYHLHYGHKFIVRAVKVSKRGSRGVHYLTIARVCSVCGFELNRAGKRMQLEDLEAAGI